MTELAAIGTVASILQLVDFTSKLISRLKEYHDQSSGISKWLQYISVELPVLNYTLRRLEEAFKNASVDPST